MSVVSVLIPVYNRKALAVQCVKSVLDQTFEDYEIVIVDNNSTDGTYENLSDEFAAEKRIRLYRNEENIGPVRNWIKCAELAKSPYAKILFSDDLMSPNFLERTLPFMLNKKCGFVYSPAIIGSSNWEGSAHYQFSPDDCRLDKNFYIRSSFHLFNLMPVSPGAGIFRTNDLRRNILTELDGIEGYDFCHTGAGVDWLIYILTALNYQHVAYVSDPLVYFRDHLDSITIKNENNDVARGYILARKWLSERLVGL
jgi:glycosyltransferase involved in cell wall biosynthesis